MKTSLAFDTSALVSLGHTELIRLIIENFKILVTKTIISELEDIAKRNDKDGMAAEKWLAVSKHLKIICTEKKRYGENELFEVCKFEHIFLITDDVRAIKRFRDEIKCYYSVHIVYILYGKGMISKERAILSVEKMRSERDWKSNVISVTARTLFQSLD